MVSIVVAMPHAAGRSIAPGCGTDAPPKTRRSFCCSKRMSRGYGRTVIYGLQRDDRTPEFYAAGRITYAEDGEPVIYVGLEQIDKEISRRGGPVLVFMPDEDAELICLSANVSHYNYRKQRKTFVDRCRSTGRVALVQILERNR